jgi:hypothetical protein
MITENRDSDEKSEPNAKGIATKSTKIHKKNSFKSQLVVMSSLERSYFR